MMRIHESPVAYSNIVCDYAGNMSYLHSNHLKINDRTWIVDNGASCYICMNKSLFSELKPALNPSFVYLPDGSCLTSHLTGNVCLYEFITL